MKFSGQGPNIHNVLAGLTDEDGQLFEQFNDCAADFPWTVMEATGPTASGRPHAGQPCGSDACTYSLVKGEMVYLTIETDRWVCWRHIPGLAEPVREEPA